MTVYNLSGLTSSQVLVTVFDVKVHLIGDLGALCCLSGLGAQKGGKSDSNESQGETTEHMHGGK